MSAIVADNAKANSNNIISTIKDTKLYVSVLTLKARDNKKYQNFLAKDLKDQSIGTERLKIRQMNIDIFSIQILLKLLDYLF